MAKINFQKIVKKVVDKAPGLVVGSVASNLVATQVTKMSNGKATPMVVAGAQIVAGAVLPGLLGSSKKDSFFEAVGEGMLAQGAVQLAKALGVPGIGATEDNDNGMGTIEDDPSLSGAESDPSISGSND